MKNGSKLLRSANSGYKFHLTDLTDEQTLEESINTFWNVKLPFGKDDTKQIAFSHENLIFHVLDNCCSSFFGLKDENNTIHGFTNGKTIG